MVCFQIFDNFLKSSTFFEFFGTPCTPFLIKSCSLMVLWTFWDMYELIWCITLKIVSFLKIQFFPDFSQKCWIIAYWTIYIYMVQYASFGNFNSNSRNFQNFDFALIFIVMHHKSSYISINSRNTLGSYRMKSFPPSIFQIHHI